MSVTNDLKTNYDEAWDTKFARLGLQCGPVMTMNSQTSSDDARIPPDGASVSDDHKSNQTSPSSPGTPQIESFSHSKSSNICFAPLAEIESEEVCEESLTCENLKNEQDEVRKSSSPPLIDLTIPPVIPPRKPARLSIKQDNCFSPLEPITRNVKCDVSTSSYLSNDSQPPKLPPRQLNYSFSDPSYNKSQIFNGKFNGCLSNLNVSSTSFPNSPSHSISNSLNSSTVITTKSRSKKSMSQSLILDSSPVLSKLTRNRKFLLIPQDSDEESPINLESEVAVATIDWIPRSQKLERSSTFRKQNSSDNQHNDEEILFMVNPSRHRKLAWQSLHRSINYRNPRILNDERPTFLSFNESGSSKVLSIKRRSSDRQTNGYKDNEQYMKHSFGDQYLYRESINSNSYHFFPLEKQPWFHADMGRKEAESILTTSPIGSFLVRKSQTSLSAYSLSLRSEKSCIHMKITSQNLDNKNVYILGEFSKAYESVAQIIVHYSRHPLPVRGSKSVLLRYPCCTTTIVRQS